MKVYREGRGKQMIFSVILSLGVRRRWLVIFMSQHLYSL
jgi:hypothetical protein